MSTSQQGSIAAALSTVISDIQSRSSQVANSTINQQIGQDRAESAKSRIGLSETRIQARQNKLENINSQLNPPPTKEVSAGKSGTKTVVDKEEVARLNKDKNATQTDIQAAENQKAEAQQEANDAVASELAAIGVTKEAQTAMNSLMDKVSNMQKQLSEGESLSDADLQDVANRYNQLKEDLPENAGGILSKEFYDPLADAITEIAASLNGGASESNETGSTNEGAAQTEAIVAASVA